jgi:hypothetical protein
MPPASDAPPTSPATVPAPPPAPAPPQEWQGWQTLVVDLAGLSAGIGVAASVDSSASSLGLVMATWYGVGIVGAPAIHEAHRHWPIGLADFGLRTLIPPLVGVGGILAACVAHDEFDHRCARDGLAGGMLVGLLGAAAIDALLLSSASTREGPGPSGSWYGLQVLAVDLVAYGVGAYYALRDPRAGHDRPHPGLALWVMDYVIGSIGAPIVHFVHGNVGLGFASLGSRLILSPLGAVIGLMGTCAGTAGRGDCAEQGAQYGLFGGSLVIALFDALVFAREAEAKSTASNFDVTLGAGSIGVHSSW